MGLLNDIFGDKPHNPREGKPWEDNDLSSDHGNPPGDEERNPKDWDFPDTNNTDGVDHLVGNWGVAHAGKVDHTKDQLAPRITSRTLGPLHGFFDQASDVDIPEQAIITRKNPQQDIRDVALQTEELVPNLLNIGVTSIPIGAKAAQVVWGNPDRRRLGLTWRSTVDVLISSNSTVAPGNGFPLAQNSGIVVWMTYTGPLWAICSDPTAAGTLYVMEEIRNADRA